MTTACCSGFGAAADQHFSQQKAERDLARLQRKGPDETTRLLRDGLVDAPLHEGSLLDVGAGIGTLAFELLDRGMTRAVRARAAA